VADKERGRWIVGAIALSLLCVAIGNSGLLLVLGQAGWFSTAIRLSITAALSWFMFDGESWARWTNAAFSALGGLLAFFSVLSAAGMGRIVPAIVLGVFAFFYLAVALVLAFSPSVAEYYREPLMEGMFKSSN
jgi:hypothetical protein